MNKDVPAQVVKPVTPYSDKSFLHTQTAAVVVPLMQSAVTGVIVFIVALAIAWIIDAMDIFSIPAALGLATFAGSWVGLQWRWISLTQLERMMGVDLNGDGVIERTPSKEPRVVKVQVTHVKDNGSLQVDLIGLPCTDVQLRQLAEGLLGGMRFTEAEWCGNGKPFSVAELKLLRQVMVSRGLLRQRSEKDSRQGFDLTDAGVAVMQGALSE